MHAGQKRADYQRAWRDRGDEAVARIRKDHRIGAWNVYAALYGTRRPTTPTGRSSRRWPPAPAGASSRARGGQGSGRSTTAST